MKLAHWAAADTILEYTGNPYMYVSGAFTTSMHESAIVKLEDPLFAGNVTPESFTLFPSTVAAGVLRCSMR